MNNMLTGLSVSTITANTTAVLSAIAPVFTLLVGLLLAFLVITSIVEMIRQKKNKNGRRRIWIWIWGRGNRRGRRLAGDWLVVV